MRKTFKEVMNMLGVPKILGPYETWPWSHYDEETQVSISAEVRMGSEDNSVEAEIQIIRDVPIEGQLPFECLLWLQVDLRRANEWCTTSMTHKGVPYDGAVHDWEERVLKVFARCAILLNQASMPDFDEIYNEEFNANDRYGERGGAGGSKAPIVRPAALLDMRKDGGGF
jgi:hypothetical protein